MYRATICCWVLASVAAASPLAETGTDGVDIRSGEYATATSQRPFLTVEFESDPQAPEQPVLVYPLDGANNVEAAPTLEVTVTDPQADTMDVTFYGRAVGAGAAEDFTIIHLPDTQYYSQSWPQIFEAQTQWIVDNLNTLNIKYVAHSGDCVNIASQAYQWVNADAAMSLIEDPVTTFLTDGVPYAIAPGNHDEAPNGDPTGTFSYNQWFGSDRFLARSYYGGHYPPANNDNSYTVFSAGGMDFIVINFEYDTSPDSDVLQWADDLLSSYSSYRAILVAHYFMNIGNGALFSFQGQMTYNALKTHPNLFLMLCGHVHGEGRRINVYQGQTVYTVQADYQALPHGGDGWLRILEFSPSGDVINVKTYSPWLDEYGTDTVMGSNTTSAEFALAYDMDSGKPFSPIGTVTSVVHKSNATMTWQGRAAGTTYEWYVDVSDGVSTTSSAVWTFTSSGTCSATIDCDDGLFCNGSETCPFNGGVCTPGTEPCLSGQLCNETTDTCTSPPTGDFDHDGDVDDVDYRSFADCLSGPGAIPQPQMASVLECISTFDFDRDGDVDLADADSFNQVFTGRLTPGDFDDDGDVDLTDYTMFSACAVGPDTWPPSLPNDVAERCLLVFDWNRDNDVDLFDFEGFQTLFTSP